MDTSQQVEAAVIGVGRMGRHHARVYGKVGAASLVAVVDHDLTRAETVADECGCAAYASVEQLLKNHPKLAAVSIAVPTAFHLETARQLLPRGVACLVEKPLASTVEQAQALVDLSRTHGAVLQVGHTERFNPAVRAVAAMDVQARFMEIHRVSPMSFRSLDVSVVMDMMIHDLDIVLMLAKSHLVTVDATGVPVFGEHADIANARLVFGNGCVANLTASRLALRTERRMRLFSETAYVSLDYHKRSAIAIHKAGNQEALERVRNELAQGKDLSDVDYSGLVRVDKLGMEVEPGQDDPLTAELSSFIEAARTGARPVVDGEAGYAAVEAAERVIHAIRSHRWEGLGAARV